MIQAPNDIKTLFAMYDLGLISPSDVRSFAVSALSEPVDEDLLQIAICDGDDAPCMAKATDVLFARHGLKDLTTADALKIYAAHIAHLIVHGALPPREGADLIARATEQHPIPGFHDLDTFKYASSEMQDRPEDKDFFEKAIVEEASAWDARSGEFRSPS